MLSIDRQHLEDKLLLMEQLIASIRSGAGLTATAPEHAAGTKPKTKGRPKTDKAMLKRNAATSLAAALNRPDILNYIQL